MRLLPLFELRYLKVLYLSGPRLVCSNQFSNEVEVYVVEVAERARMSGSEQTRIFFQQFQIMLKEHWLLWIYGKVHPLSTPCVAE